MDGVVVTSFLGGVDKDVREVFARLCPCDVFKVKRPAVVVGDDIANDTVVLNPFDVLRFVFIKFF